MPRVPPPTRPPGAPRLGGVYTGTGAGGCGLESWLKPLTEIPKRNPVTIVLAKTVATYFIVFSPRVKVTDYSESIVHAKTTLPQNICNLQWYWNSNIRRRKFHVYFVNTP